MCIFSGQKQQQHVTGIIVISSLAIFSLNVFFDEALLLYDFCFFYRTRYLVH